MAEVPLISVVTPSFNQGRFIGETLQSLVDQDYPSLEVIIQDGGSTDGAVAVAKSFVDRYPQIFQLFVERDDGQADALNRGFARARGQILGFLNSDDTLYPGCLRRVASEIDPARGRLVVFGRCLFTGADSPYVGVEHPAEYRGHFDLLAIWKRGFNTLPQPSVFWHRRVWERCGGFNVHEHHALDYDFFCRVSRQYRFHKVDELWSTFRMHAISKSAQRTEAEVLALSIAVSRRHWGPWYSPLRWRCELSHWYHNRDWYEHARHHARRCEDAGRNGHVGRALWEFCRTLRYSPKMARDRLFHAWLAEKRLRFLERLFWSEKTFTGRYSDLWIGPIYRDTIEVPPAGKRLLLTLQHTPQGYHQKVTVALRINRRIVAEKTLTDGCQFLLEADVAKFRGTQAVVELRCDAYFVPRFVHNTPDDRQLSLQLFETRVETA